MIKNGNVRNNLFFIDLVKEPKKFYIFDDAINYRFLSCSVSDCKKSVDESLITVKNSRKTMASSPPIRTDFNSSKLLKVQMVSGSGFPFS